MGKLCRTLLRGVVFLYLLFLQSRSEPIFVVVKEMCWSPHTISNSYNECCVIKRVRIKTEISSHIQLSFR